MSRFINDTYWVFWREMKHLQRQRFRIFMTIFQPIIWLTLMGNVFQKVASVPGFPSDSYLNYMAPGIVVMVTLFGGVFGGMTLIWDRRLGFLQKMIAAPISRTSIILGKMFSIAVQTIFQVTIIFIVSLTMSVNFSTGIGGFLVMIILSSLLCMVFAGISLSLGAIATSHETLIAAVNLLTMPMMFTSNAMMPLEMMPNWLSKIARYNPITYAVNPIRSLFLTGYDWNSIVMAGLMLGISMFLLTSLAVYLFRKNLSL
ncbi:MAG: ABC transporter permease [Actinomycetia bacterium]|nr:ABC transporter permease [Actinomycetes bacterium]